MQAGNIGKQDMNKLCCKCRQEYVHVGKKYRGIAAEITGYTGYISTNVVSSNPVLGEVCSIQLHVKKFVNDLRQVGGFLRVFWFPPPIKLTAAI
jgi:hypothetical protein